MSAKRSDEVEPPHTSRRQGVNPVRNQYPEVSPLGSWLDSSCNLANDLRVQAPTTIRDPSSLRVKGITGKRCGVTGHVQTSDIPATGNVRRFCRRRRFARDPRQRQRATNGRQARKRLWLPKKTHPRIFTHYQHRESSIK